MTPVDPRAVLAHVLGEDDALTVIGTGGRPLFIQRSRDLLGLQLPEHGESASREDAASSDQTVLERIVPSDRASLMGLLFELTAGKIDRIERRVRAEHVDGSLRVLDISIEDTRAVEGIGGLLVRATDVTQRIEQESVRTDLVNAGHFRNDMARRLEDVTLDVLNFALGPALVEMASWNTASAAYLEMSQNNQRHYWRWTRGSGMDHARLDEPTDSDPSTIGGTDLLVLRPSERPAGALRAMWDNGARIFATTGMQTSDKLTVRLTLGWPDALDRDINRSLVEIPKYVHLLSAPLARLATYWERQGQGRRFETMVSQLNDALLIWRPDGTVAYATPSIEALIGYTPDELYSGQVKWHDGVDPARAKSVFALEPGESTPPQQFRLIHKSGSARMVETVTSNLLYDPAVNGYLTTGRDVTERVLDDERRQRQEGLTKVSARISSRFVNGSALTFDLNLRLVLEDLGQFTGCDRVLLWQANDRGQLAVTHEQSGSGRRNVGHLIPAIDIDRMGTLLPSLADSAATLCVRNGEGAAFIEAISVDGPTMLGVTLVAPMFLEGSLIGMLSLSGIIDEAGANPLLAQFANESTQQTLRAVAELLTNILAREATAQALAYHAAHDTLTGLANRRVLLAQCERIVEEALDNQTGIALMFLDLDDFKTINDTLGHDVGDQLLVKVAEVLVSLAEPNDVVARLGGDEFVVVRESANSTDSVILWAQRLRDALATRFTLQNHEIQVHASIGAVACDPTTLASNSAGDLLRKADIAMYRAKSEGGNRCELFTEQMEASTRRRFELQAELQSGVALKQFELEYQPILNVSSGQMEGCEALIRWHHPTRGIIPPNEFISLAESSGLISDLGVWAIDRAAHDLAHLMRHTSLTSDFWMAVNVSALQLTDRRLLRTLTDAAHREGLLHSQLVIELTESTLINRDKVVPMLVALKDSGFSVSVDDFGTGFSSLSYLRHLPMDTLKIDRSFTCDIDSEGRGLAMVRALVALAHELDLHVVAEGVETQAQLDLLTAMGCDSAQGWLFSKAVSISRLQELVKDSRTFAGFDIETEPHFA